MLPAPQLSEGRTARAVRPLRSHWGDDADVACLRALRPLLHLVLHLRALGQALEALAADRAVVDEDVLATIVLRDEAVTLVVVEPLHGSGCHIHTSFDCVTNVQRKALSQNRYSLLTHVVATHRTRTHRNLILNNLQTEVSHR